VLDQVSGQPIRSASASATAAKPSLSSRGRRSLWLGGAALAAAAVAIAGVLFATTQTTAPPPSVDIVRNDLAVATSGYRCAALTYAADNSGAATVSGYVESDQDLARLRNAVGAVHGVSRLNFNVQRRVWPYCGVLALLKPILASGERAPTIRLASAATPAYAGRPLVLDVQAPAFDSYVYVDYFQANGQVAHLLPNGKDWINLRPARNRFALGRQPMLDCWKFAGTPGEQMITLVASRRPLFASADASAIESAQDYLARLAQALSDNTSGDGESATTLFYDLGSGNAAIANDDGCAAQ
jgi:eukaryotic-like serine/threonine-protein kinase